MNSLFRQQGSGRQSSPSKEQSSLAGLGILANLINRLVGLITLTEEERENAGIYLDRLGGE